MPDIEHGNVVYPDRWNQDKKPAPSARSVPEWKLQPRSLEEGLNSVQGRIDALQSQHDRLAEMEQTPNTTELMRKLEHLIEVGRFLLTREDVELGELKEYLESPGPMVR